MNAIKGTEQNVAISLGEIFPPQITRSDHYGHIGPSVGDLSAKEQSRCAGLYNFLLIKPILNR